MCVARYDKSEHCACSRRLTANIRQDYRLSLIARINFTGSQRDCVTIYSSYAKRVPDGFPALAEYRQEGDEGDDRSKNCDCNRSLLSALSAVFLIV